MVAKKKKHTQLGKLDLTSEIAVGNPRIHNTSGVTFNPDKIAARKGLQEYDLVRVDDQVKAAMAFKKLAVTKSGYSVASPPGKPEDWVVTKFVEAQLLALAGTLNETIKQILLGLDYGFSVTEKVYAPVLTGKWRGMFGLKALKTKAPHDIRFNTDKFGNFLDESIIQNGAYFPRNKFVVFTNEGEFGNPYGHSDLEAAYRSWYIKDMSYKWLAMGLERFGIHPLIAFYNQKIVPKQIQTGFATILKNMQAATTAVVPRGDSPDDITLWTHTHSGEMVSAFKEVFTMLNSDISRALLVPSLIGMTPDQNQGSLARSNTHFDSFMMIVESLRKTVEEDVMQEQVIKQLVDLNFFVDDYPVFKFDPISDDVKIDIMNTWKVLLDGGAVSMSDDDEDHIRQQMQFPKRKPGVLRKEPIKPPIPTPIGPSGFTDDHEPFIEVKMPRVFENAKPLYIRRDVLNWQEISNYYKSQGASTTLGDEMHVTIVYSKTPVDWAKLPADTKPLSIYGGERSVMPLGDKGATVMSVSSTDLTVRHNALKALGCSSDYDAYKPHVTITYDQCPTDIKPYAGTIQLGPEVYQEIDPKWASKVTEMKSTDVPRKLTVSERRIDFKALDNSFEAQSVAGTEKLTASLTVILDSAKNNISENYNGTLEFINGFEIDPSKTLHKDMFGVLKTAYEYGKQTIKNEFPKKFATLPNVDPQDAIDYLNSKSIYITDVLEQKLIDDAKAVMLKGLQNGSSVDDMIKMLDELFAPYVGSVVLDEVVNPSRLETIIRTNLTDAINQGRLVQGRQAEDFLLAWQYSAILDNRTTEVCQNLHGKIFLADDPEVDALKPPRHFNCRSVLAAVVVGDTYDDADLVDAQIISEAKAQSGKGF